MLNFEVYPNGNSNKWAVFVHGIGGSTLTWKKQIADFQKEYNILLLDLPGHGGSDDIHGKLNHKLVNDEIKEVLDELHIEKAEFIGMSLGTLVILSFAVTYPEYVHAIVLGGAIINIEGFYRLLVKLASGTKQLLPKIAMYHIFAEIIMPAKWHKKSRSIFFRECKKLKRVDFHAWVDYISNMAQQNKIIQKLKALKLPILFVSGDHDSCFINGIRHLSDKLANTKLIVLEKCGHVCTIEQYKEFNQYALEYLHDIPVAA